MDKIDAFFSSPTFAGIAALLMVAVGLLFVFYYKSGQDFKKKLNDIKTTHAAAIMQKKCEIEKRDQHVRELVWQRHERDVRIKILEDQLTEARAQLANEQHKVLQLLKGATHGE